MFWRDRQDLSIAYPAGITILESKMKAIDLTGQRFGLLTALRVHSRSRAPCGQLRVVWECVCDCGKTTTAMTAKLRRGQKKSCGCRNPEENHGQSKTKLYGIWEGIIQRTTNPNDLAWRYYGGRGVVVCARWRSFTNFFTDMGESYCHGLTIERVDNNKGYEPGNCTWATREQQTLNRRSTRWWDYHGQRMTAKQIASVAGSPVLPRLICLRLKRGWSIERATVTPSQAWS